MKHVAIIGASDNPERYAYKAFKKLQQNGYGVIPVHPVLDTIEDVPVVRSLDDIEEDVYAATLYVRPSTGERYIDQINRLKPKKVIMNPGSESDRIEAECSPRDIIVLRACTLVLLSSGQFENAG
ncbi:MAG: CoA-binding protein [Spirochaetota bacterium]